jgi:hypothetical protein
MGTKHFEPAIPETGVSCLIPARIVQQKVQV